MGVGFNFPLVKNTTRRRSILLRIESPYNLSDLDGQFNFPFAGRLFHRHSQVERAQGASL